MIDEFRTPASRSSADARFSRASRAGVQSRLASVIALAAAAVVLAVFGFGPMLERLEHRGRTAEQPPAVAKAQPGG